jgi:hypothetical protein
MIARDEKLLPQSCLNRSQPDEPVFVLAARDKCASLLVRIWCLVAALLGTPSKKIADARVLAEEMDDWQELHGSKVPD